MQAECLNNLPAGSFMPIAEKCEGCDRIKEADGNKFCKAFANPSSKWRLGPCSMATHIKIETKGSEKTRVGQQKQKGKKK